VLGLALEWVATNPVSAGEILVPDEIENQAGTLALEALEELELPGG
jgi:hypothetical protein